MKIMIIAIIILIIIIIIAYHFIIFSLHKIMFSNQPVCITPVSRAFVTGAGRVGRGRHAGGVGGAGGVRVLAGRLIDVVNRL